MDRVTLREAQDDLPGLVERVERGEEFIITRDGAPVVRMVRETLPAPAGKRVLTPEQEEALEEGMAILRRGWPLDVGTFDREDVYAERLERQDKPWRG